MGYTLEQLLREGYTKTAERNGYEIWENGYWRVYLDKEKDKEIDMHRF